MKCNSAPFSLLSTTLLALTSCDQHQTAPQKTEIASPFKPVATLQELMVSVIDPNIDPIWNSVSTVSTKSGTVEKVPQTDEEWTQLRHHAVTLTEVSNLLAIEGRPIAVEGASTSIHPVELSPADIQKTIAANRADFNKHAQAFQNATQLLLQAIDNKNTEELVQAGGVVEHVCEQCHKQFWYPNDKLPSANIDLSTKK
ncbi:MAG: cytochrome c [Methylophilaceae bacterium]|nr:cytochrome c [Methylophilaceae bacterium]